VGVIDMAWHELSVEEAEALTADDVEAFEAKALEEYGLDYSPVPTRYRSTYCTHIFAGGYSAGYYGYFWSEVLDADTVEWFKARGGFKQENGMRFREKLLSRGGSQEAMTMFRNFSGANADINYLLKRRGLI
jgi:peptidyl-dipeptidase Dcp